MTNEPPSPDAPHDDAAGLDATPDPTARPTEEPALPPAPAWEPAPVAADPAPTVGGPDAWHTTPHAAATVPPPPPPPPESPATWAPSTGWSPPPTVDEPTTLADPVAAPPTTGLADPVAPPSPVAEAAVRTVTPRWVLPVAILAALALFAGGALAGWAVAERDDDGPGVAGSGEQADGETATVSDTAPPPVGDDVDEPVAAVAAAVSPAVVQIETDTGLGSGVVYDDEGHILTAAHVIADANQIRVRLADGTLVAAEVVGSNAATDVGVVAIEPRDDLEPAVLGVDVDVEVGQLAVAVGSPFGLDQSVTSGIVSAVDRPVETEGTSIVGMIQTDASINPGNSGGALADRHGRIIGINDAIRTSGGGNEGVGFAIPIDLAVRVADQIIAGDDIQAGLLGVTVGDPTDGLAGALVSDVMPGSPADEAGLQVGDLITAIDGERVTQMRSLRAMILARPPGTRVVVDVVREGEAIEVEVVLASATG